MQFVAENVEEGSDQAESGDIQVEDGDENGKGGDGDGHEQDMTQMRRREWRMCASTLPWFHVYVCVPSEPYGKQVSFFLRVGWLSKYTEKTYPIELCCLCLLENMVL